MEPVIRLRNLTKHYRGIRALDDVSIDIEPGITGLLGPNGAGKTTLIKALLGFIRVTRGSGEVLGYRMGRQAREIRSRVGFMPEEDCYIAGLTGVALVQFAARLTGIPSTEALRRAHEILDFCGIEQERYRRVETYSVGMRQKLKFAQSVVHDPPLLIFDEPTAGLDPEARADMLVRIRTLAEKANKSILYSTHILHDVQETCDRVIILAAGSVRIVERLDVLRRPSEETFDVRVLGDPAPFIKSLEQHGLETRVGLDGTLTVRTADAEPLWTHARNAGVGIRSLHPSRNSLEQIFMEAIGGGDDAHP